MSLALSEMIYYTNNYFTRAFEASGLQLGLNHYVSTYAYHGKPFWDIYPKKATVIQPIVAREGCSENNGEQIQMARDLYTSCATGVAVTDSPTEQHAHAACGQIHTGALSWRPLMPLRTSRVSVQFVSLPIRPDGGGTPRPPAGRVTLQPLRQARRSDSLCQEGNATHTAPLAHAGGQDLEGRVWARPELAKQASLWGRAIRLPPYAGRCPKNPLHHLRGALY